MAYQQTQYKATTEEIARKVGGTLHGTEDVIINTICPIDEPTPLGITFLKAKSTQHTIKSLAGLPVGVVLVNKEVLEVWNETFPPLIVVDDPFKSLISLVSVFYKPILTVPNISKNADIHPSAKIGKEVTIGAFSVIEEGVEIADGVHIHPHVVIYRDCYIGPLTTIHSNAVIRERTKIHGGSVIQNGAIIGADGFGYIVNKEKGLLAVPQLGTVEIKKDVDVGANTCIDRGAFGTTIIGTGTKIDNLAQIGHNVKVGSHSVLCGMVGIAGSARIGNHVVLGGGVGISDHVRISDNIRVAGRSVVASHLTESGDYSGFPAIPYNEWRRHMSAARKLPELIKKFSRSAD
jgi:UDP-3-O-[3-hydroxymyristoyl] glucosamine N-acyltransferase